MNQELNNVNNQRTLLWAGLAGLAALISLVTITHRVVGAEDRHLNPECTPLYHQQPCEHKTTRNPGMCWPNVPLCSGATDSNLCVSTNITYYEVMDDFPQGERDDSTTICRQYVNGTGEFTIWAAHHNVISPAHPCYRKVTCRWNSTTRRCEFRGAVTPWYYMPKRIAVECQ